MYKIGIDIGGTKCAVVLGEIYGNDVRFAGKLFFDTVKDGGYETTLLKIERSMENLLLGAGLKFEQTESIGISCGGPLDNKAGIILSPPNLPGWDSVEICKRFKNKYNIKSVLENDANACAAAEWKFGAGKGKNLKNVIFLTFGTGFGAGLILDGKLYAGTNGMAGEIGHIRADKTGPVGYGKAGSFEGFCSGGGIAQLGGASAKELAEAAKNGDAEAAAVYKKSGEYLGRALAVLVDLLNPEMIIIGSIYQRCEDLLKAACMETLEREALRRSLDACEIVPAVLGDDIGLYAALAL
ncbi:MAG: ROK family protein [Oscillospiraceae bacterium]|nr:ROK family protein [Oscillospiraceae bacterium]